MKPENIIIHLASNDAWLAAAKQGVYHADSLSTMGFIHCSRPSQIVDVANTFYHGQQGLVLLLIDPSKLVAELKWEPPAEPEPTHARAGDLFTDVIPFESAADGTFYLPPEL